jgi:lipopolysaccharide O-acetyltransferase
VLIASGVFISDHNHGAYSGPSVSSPLVPPAERPLQVLPVVIEDDVWIGEQVCILPGVRVGKGAIVGAGAIVTKSLPPYTIAVGAPAKVIKRFDFDANAWLPVP